jgi:hypothetical protein
MLGVETADPGLMKLSRFHQEPLRGERFAIDRLHYFLAKDTPLLTGLPAQGVTVRLNMETPPGRRVLVAVVTGQLGARIQAWREEYDPKHAARLPPHLTVCYRPPDAPLAALEAQVRLGFPQPVDVRLGPVFVLAHREAPLAVGVLETAALDAARRRLFDCTHAEMGGRDEWPWHITCVRYGHNRDRDALLAAAAEELALDDPWTIASLSYLELRNGRYEPVAEWEL